MKIFNDENDYNRFITTLYLANIPSSPKFSDLIHTSPSPAWTVTSDKNFVAIGSYCLMPNHFHILIKVTEPKGVSDFMHRLITSYSKYFNTKNERTGTLFEGRFKAKHIDKDVYLKYLFAYIHLNPIKLINSNWKESSEIDIDSSKKFLREYKYSSYDDYTGISRPQNKIINRSAFPDYFTSENKFEDFLDYFMETKKYV